MREHTRMPLIAKIEKPQAVEQAEEIIRAADCVMVARGDLGIELPIEDVPVVQKQLLRIAGRLARPSITATQMLDSMVASPRPTRAEVADVANAILDGTDAVMLSQETAVGAYPVEAVAMMAAIAARTERDAALRALERGARPPRRARSGLHGRPQRLRGRARARTSRRSRADAVGPLGAPDLRAPAERADLRALAGEGDGSPLRLMWGVQAASMRRYEITEELIADAALRVVELGWVRPGERSASPPGFRAAGRGRPACFRSSACKCSPPRLRSYSSHSERTLGRCEQSIRMHCT